MVLVAIASSQGLLSLPVLQTKKATAVRCETVGKLEEGETEARIIMGEGDEEPAWAGSWTKLRTFSR